MTFLDLLSFGFMDCHWRERKLSGFIIKYLNLCFEPKSDGFELQEVIMMMLSLKNEATHDDQLMFLKSTKYQENCCKNVLKSISSL